MCKPWRVRLAARKAGRLPRPLFLVYLTSSPIYKAVSFRCIAVGHGERKLTGVKGPSGSVAVAKPMQYLPPAALALAAKYIQ